jgi:hypothetical protein
MVFSSSSQRRLFMHPAHRTVGVSGGGAFRPYCCGKGGAAADRYEVDAWATAPLRVVLAACASDLDGLAAMSLFERAIAADAEVQCHRTTFVNVGSELAADADCIAVFRQGVHVARWRADLSVVRLVGDSNSAADGWLAGEIKPAVQWHPVLEGVRPFVAWHRALTDAHLSVGATVLMTGVAGGELRPAAWVESGPTGAEFHAVLGCREDLANPELVRLMVNAVKWVGLWEPL